MSEQSTPPAAAASPPEPIQSMTLAQVIMTLFLAGIYVELSTARDGKVRLRARNAYKCKLEAEFGIGQMDKVQDWLELSLTRLENMRQESTHANRANGGGANGGIRPSPGASQGGTPAAGANPNRTGV